MKKPLVSVVILNWNALEYTVECLESLLKQTYQNFRIILCDNGSKDGSAEKLSQYLSGNLDCSFLEKSRHAELTWPPLKFSEPLTIHSDGKPPKVKYLRFLENIGFSRCCNAGIRVALSDNDAEFVLILNNDTVLAPDYLEKLLKPALKYHDAGIIGSKVYFFEERDRIQSLGGRFLFADWELFTSEKQLECYAEKLEETIFRVSLLTGCGLLIRRELISELPVPEVYYHFWEDIELFYRAELSGYRILLSTEAEIWHKGGVSCGYNSGHNYFSAYYGTRNKIMFTRRNLGLREKLYIYGIFIARLLIRIMFYRLKPEVKKGMLHGIIDGIRGIRGKTC